MCNQFDTFVGKNEEVNEGDLWEMEVVRSREKEKRTLHRGKQQKGFIKGVPDNLVLRLGDSHLVT